MVFLGLIIGGITYFFGKNAYLRYHHVWTHNLLFSVVVSVFALAWCKGHRLKALVFTQLAFYTHYFGDWFFTQYPSKYLYPFSHHWFCNLDAYYLKDPVNYVLAAAGILIILGFAVWLKRTPIEVLSASFDRRVVNMFFRKKELSCHVCERGANERCTECGKPVCVRHGRLGKGCSVVCDRCGIIPACLAE